MTETIEYRTIDKSAWPRGPWDHEIDKRQFKDEATGLPCLIVRGPSGALCGYVGVTPDHPDHGKDYDDVSVEVHYGLTFASGCSHGDPEHSICHIPGAGEPDDVWWFGFDCAHSGDLCPQHNQYVFMGDEYRDVAFVEREIASMARQLANQCQ